MNATSPVAAERRILVLASAKADDQRICSQFGKGADIRIVRTFDDAMAALRDHRYDFVILDRDEFLSLETAALNRQAAAVLESIAQGVCLVDREGHVVWSNAVMKTHPDDLLTAICTASAKALQSSPDDESKTTPRSRARRFSLAAGDDQYFDVAIAPVLEQADNAAVASVIVWDVTNQRRLQRKIDAIDLAGRELVRLDGEATAGMTIEERISLLEQKILRYMHDLLHFDNFAVLLIDKKTNKLEIALQHGMSERSRDLDIYAESDGNGISGYVAAVGRSYVCPDTSKDARYLMGLESARSSLTVPLRLQDKIIGVFDIESDEPEAFNEDDRQFAEILAGHIAIALNILDLLVIERFHSTGRLADDVAGEIAGPLNDILTETSAMMDEYIADEHLRRRLASIGDKVSEIKQIIKEVASPQTGILGRRCEVTCKDPLLEGKRVLVADDEEIIRETVASVLRKHGCEVETAADGIQAVAMIGQRPYDLVLADIKMPCKNGYEVFAAARDSNACTPVILMTGFGYDPNHSIVRARREGLSAVLFKPFKVEQLVTEVRGALQPAAT